MKIFGFNISREKALTQIENVADEKRPASADVRRRIIKPQQQVIITKEDQATLKSAIIAAESTVTPQRALLYRLYKRIDYDAHLTAAVQQRKNLTLSRKFKVVNKAGEENEQLTALIQKKWFFDFVDLALDSIFWGYSLIQFGDLIKDEFTNVELVPRIYVKPEFHTVVETTAGVVGVDYLSAPYRDWCIGVGKERDLGLYVKAAPLILWKQGALGAWSNFQQLFGIPIRIGKTGARDEATRANMELMLKDMGQALYAIVDTDDIIELLEQKNTDAYQVFDMMIARCNQEISKLILGQTGTMDEKAYVGAAEVMERVVSNYMEADEVFTQGVLNYQLIPLLERHGIMFNGDTIICEDDEDIPLTEAIKIDAELMKVFDVDEKYIMEKYGTPVKKKPEPKVDPGMMRVKNDLDEYYS
jgi:phage gp29-like protein